MLESKSNPVLDEARSFWAMVKEHPVEKSFRTEAITNIKYLTGEDQGWDEDGARGALEAEGRPALTLNRTHPIIRLICGAKPQLKVSYLPSEQGHEQTATILSACKDHIEDDNLWRFKENDLMLQALVVKRAVVELRPNFSRDPRGEIDLKLVNPNNVYLDPDSEERDRSDQQRMAVVAYVNKQEALRLFPHKKAEIEQFVGYVEGTTSTRPSVDVSSVDGYRDSPTDYYANETKRLCLIYYWYKTYEKSVKVIDVETGQAHDFDGDREEAESQILAINGQDRYQVVEREFTRVNYLVFSHDIEFERGITPWEREDGQRTKLSENFPFVIEELDRIVFGLQTFVIDFMAQLRDPQKYHNKLASSILHIINSVAKGGYDYEDGAISPEEKKKLEETGSKPGTNIKWSHGAVAEQRFRPRQGGQIPQAEMAIAETMTRELLDISGVESLISTRSLGKNASGRAIDAKQQQGGNIISWVYETHLFYMHLLAEFIRDAIQTMYDYEKVVRIRGDKPQYMVLNQKQYDQQGGITEILNNVTEGRFATRVREKQDIPTIKVERFKYFTELVKSGVLQLPSQVLLGVVMELMDDPDLKDQVQQEFQDFMKQQQQLAQQRQGMRPEIKENLSIDKLYPLLDRSEQVQILAEIGIKPNANAKVSGLPDSTETLKAGVQGKMKAEEIYATAREHAIDAVMQNRMNIQEGVRE